MSVLNEVNLSVERHTNTCTHTHTHTQIISYVPDHLHRQSRLEGEGLAPGRPSRLQGTNDTHTHEVVIADYN